MMARRFFTRCWTSRVEVALLFGVPLLILALVELVEQRIGGSSNGAEFGIVVENARPSRPVAGPPRRQRTVNCLHGRIDKA